MLKEKHFRPALRNDIVRQRSDGNNKEPHMESEGIKMGTVCLIICHFQDNVCFQSENITINLHP